MKLAKSDVAVFIFTFALAARIQGFPQTDFTWLRWCDISGNQLNDFFFSFKLSMFNQKLDLVRFILSH